MEEPLPTYLKWAYPNNPPAPNTVLSPRQPPERPEVKKPSKLNKTPSNVEHLYKPEVLSPIYPTLPAYLANRNRVIAELRIYAKARAIEALDLRRWARNMSRWSFDTIREFKKFLEPRMKEVDDLATERHQAWVGQYHQAALAKYWEDRCVKAESEKEELKRELRLVKEKQHEEKEKLQRREQLVEKAETGFTITRDPRLIDWLEQRIRSYLYNEDLISQWANLVEEQQLFIQEKTRWLEEMQTKEQEYRWQIKQDVKDEAKREGEFNSISWQAGHSMGYTTGTMHGFSAACRENRPFDPVGQVISRKELEEALTALRNELGTLWFSKVKFVQEEAALEGFHRKMILCAKPTPMAEYNLLGGSQWGPEGMALRLARMLSQFEWREDPNTPWFSAEAEEKDRLSLRNPLCLDTSGYFATLQKEFYRLKKAKTIAKAKAKEEALEKPETLEEKLEEDKKQWKKEIQWLNWDGLQWSFHDDNVPGPWAFWLGKGRLTSGSTTLMANGKEEGGTEPDMTKTA
ncbi:hypothetical protein BS50DRAFT_581572 [Corynespora cassiicola Philippines]|uniref:Uncharacterized protein n=1 Tax=Corynespora cassiicola Philippines TaxID=1448308 RepID=A0A2T2PB75_CORCC|nr:hypothetical protein BS50DRAFT_581572 [Corynespora cassiicola Philippines]